MKLTTTTKLFAVPVMAAALALSACGGSSDSDSSSSSGASSAGASGAASGSAAASGDSDAKRTVTDAVGKKVEVPEHPKRVVTTHYAGTQAVYDIGGTLVGQGTFENGIIPTKWESTLGKVPVVTDKDEVNVEKIAEEKPDLILVPNTTEEDVLAQLKEIAPVYEFTLRSKDRGNWQKRVEEVADALNMKSKPAELREAFTKRQNDIKTKYANVIKGKNVAVVGSFEDNNVYLWSAKNMTGTILTPLGFTWSPQEEKAVAGQQLPENTVSVEKLNTSVGDADIIFYDTNLRAEASDFMKSLMNTSMWKNLKAVKAGNAFPGGKNTVAGYADANYTLDMVEAALAKVK